MNDEQDRGEELGPVSEPDASSIGAFLGPEYVDVAFVTAPRAEIQHTSTPALDAAIELLVAAVNGGVRDIVVCPGSRSQALALVAAELERIGAVRVHVRIDERSAAFFALGLARESQRPVPVITTSGSAVANLHPAMLEAHHSGVPLIAITGDRPPELHGTAANQTTRQVGLFGPQIPVISLPAPQAASPFEFWGSIGRSIAGAVAAVHVNFAAREPLSGRVHDLSGRIGEASEPATLPSPSAIVREILDIMPSGGLGSSDIWTRPLGMHLRPDNGVEHIDPAQWPSTIVVAGDGAGAKAERVAWEGGWPLIAEPSSGARFGRNLLVAYHDLLAGDSPVPQLRDGIENVIVFGHPTLTRQVNALINRPGVRVLVIDQPAMPQVRRRGDSEEISLRARRAKAQQDDPVIPELHANGVEILDFGANMALADEELAQRQSEAKAWTGQWLQASRAIMRERAVDAPAPDIAASRSTDPRERARFGRAELEITRQPLTRAILVDAVWNATWPHDRLVLAASRLIRDLDRQVSGKKIRVYSNRGLAGIDGTIATALGVATAQQAAGAYGVTRLLTGDLAFAHDASSLLVAQGGESAPRTQIIVGNDGGGTIFDSLEVKDAASPAAFDRVQYTPLTLDIAAVAAAYGWEYRRATTRGELETALTDGSAPRVIIEVPLPRA